MATDKHPTELRRGDQVGTKKSGYTLLGDPFVSGNMISVRVQHHPDGGHDVRQWDLREVGDEKCVPVFKEGTL
jgi:hypothetical protein